MKETGAGVELFFGKRIWQAIRLEFDSFTHTSKAPELEFCDDEAMHSVLPVMQRRFR
jgi:hypothetical protein